jgi:hypothetical protein
MSLVVDDGHRVISSTNGESLQQVCSAQRSRVSAVAWGQSSSVVQSYSHSWINWPNPTASSLLIVLHAVDVDCNWHLAWSWPSVRPCSYAQFFVGKMREESSGQSEASFGLGRVECDTLWPGKEALNNLVMLSLCSLYVLGDGLEFAPPFAIVP